MLFVICHQTLDYIKDLRTEESSYSKKSWLNLEFAQGYLSIFSLLQKLFSNGCKATVNSI